MGGEKCRFRRENKPIFEPEGTLTLNCHSPLIIGFRYRNVDVQEVQKFVLALYWEMLASDVTFLLLKDKHHDSKQKRWKHFIVNRYL